MITRKGKRNRIEKRKKKKTKKKKCEGKRREKKKKRSENALFVQFASATADCRSSGGSFDGERGTKKVNC